MPSLFFKDFLQNRFSALKREGQRGQTLFIMALVISATLIAISLALSTIMQGELAISADAGYYVPAFYAADAGVEKGLYCQRNGISCTQLSATLGNNASYAYEVDNPGVNQCPSGTANLCIFSKGMFKGLARRIQVSY